MIKYGVFEPGYGREIMRLDSYYEKYIHAMDNAFSLVDGQGISHYPGDAVTIIKDACINGKMCCQTKYFNLKWYKNGNLHVVFRRMGLVYKINQIAGEGLLKRDECHS